MFSWIIISHSRVLIIMPFKICLDTIMKSTSSTCCPTLQVYQWLLSREVHNWPRSLNSFKNRKVCQRFTWSLTLSVVSILELQSLSLEQMPKWEVWLHYALLIKGWDWLIIALRNPISVRSAWQIRHWRLSVFHRKMHKSSHHKTWLTSTMLPRMWAESIISQ